MMKRINLRLSNNKTAIIWPDHPLVIAGDEILKKIISHYEEKKNDKEIIDFLALKYQVTKSEAAEYINNILKTLQESEVYEQNNRDSIKKDARQNMNNLSMATFNITRRCNLRCLHCYAGIGINHDIGHEMNKNEVVSTVSTLARSIFREPKLLIISGGEPTLEKEKLKTAIATARKNGLNVRLNTNGHKIDWDLANFLFENQVLVQVSLDGPNPGINSILRGSELAYYEAINAIEKLTSKKCRTRISCTTHSGNINEIPAMLELAENFEVEQFTTSSLVGIGSALRNGLKTVEYKKEFEILYSAVKTNTKRQKMTKSTLLAETINAIRAGIRFTYCGTGSCTCCIDADGAIYPCINMIKPGYRIGNILENEFSEIWEKSQTLKLLRGINVDTINRQCAECIFRYFCGAYCRGETVEAGKNTYSPYIRCKEWKRGILQILCILSESPDIYYFGDDPYKGVMHRE